jgi:DNA polymerase-3 subunit delta
MDVMAKVSEKTVFALVGGQEYLKNDKIQALVKSLPEGSEITELDGKVINVATVLDDLRTFPFLNPHRAVIVRNAGSLVSADEEPMIRYIENPVDFSTLILDFENLDGRSKFAKALKKHGREMRFEHMREYQVPQWLAGRAQSNYGKRLNLEDAKFIVDMVGTNPGILDSELAKIASLSPGSKAIQREDVERVITRGRAQTVFKLTEQVEAKSRPEALKLLNDILSQGVYDERAGSVNTESANIAPYLLHMLNWSLGRLWNASRLLSKDESEEDISAQLRLHARFKEQFFSNVRKFWPMAECRRCHRELLLADRQIKASTGAVPILLETLVVKLSTPPKARGTGAR